MRFETRPSSPDFIARSSCEISRRDVIASAVQLPCFSALLFPCGAPGDFPPCIRQRPFFIAGDWHHSRSTSHVLRISAEAHGNLLASACSSDFGRFPPPGVPTLPTEAVRRVPLHS